jgi:hypothetical protein
MKLNDENKVVTIAIAPHEDDSNEDDSNTEEVVEATAQEVPQSENAEENQ